MKPFHESLRVTDYDIAPDDVVIDAGAFEGNFSLWLSERYGCRILAFEPVPEFADGARKKLAPFPKVEVHTFGLSDSTRSEMFSIKGDMTGIASYGTTSVRVMLRDIAEVMDEYANVLKDVALFKINCEGSEYPLLERILSLGLAPRFRNLQIQWHSVVPDYVNRRATIEALLRLTHEETWEPAAFDNAWANWRRK